MERAQRILLQEGTRKYLRTKASEGYSPRVCRLVTLLIFKLENLQTMHVWKKKKVIAQNSSSQHRQY